uniref:Archease domain-containing protein n=1 Tax=Meloidogyne hapla TaxID=6305 RepID=A0A1I8B5G3_MELHA
ALLSMVCSSVEDSVTNTDMKVKFVGKAIESITLKMKRWIEAELVIIY